MKTNIKNLAIILFSLLLHANSFAQFYSELNEKPRLKSKSNAAVLSAGIPVYSKMKSSAEGILEINYPEVAQQFSTFFPLATNQLWIKENTFLHVSFLNEGNKVSSVFTLQGHMNYCITQLQISGLPEYIAQKIKSRYPFYSYFNIKEIRMDKNKVYKIILENISQFIVISIRQDEMEEIGKVVKT